MPPPSLDHRRYRETNRRLWDAWARRHYHSPYYDNDRFRAGALSLRRIEQEEVGDVRGKSLLHLQCHFGQDTLSWARLGAQVTGVDFSQEAIRLACRLATELHLPARFICADIYDLPTALDETFDIVFTSYGVLTWLPDLDAWGQIVARYLKPGGMFYLVEFHPLSIMLDDTLTEPRLCIRYPYYHADGPMCFEDGLSYAAEEETSAEPLPSYQWGYSLGEVLNALLQAGLQPEFLHEHPVTTFRQLPFLEKGADGWYRLPASLPQIPLLFSLRARKPG